MDVGVGVGQMPSGHGVDVMVGVRVAVGVIGVLVAVAVRVAVGVIGVLVAVAVRVAVAVGGNGVLVGGTGVLVGGTGVLVGGNGVFVAVRPVIEPLDVPGDIGAPAGFANSTTPSAKLLTAASSIWKVMSHRGGLPWIPVVLAPTHLTTVGPYAVLHNGPTLNRWFGSATQAVGLMTAGS